MTTRTRILSVVALLVLALLPAVPAAAGKAPRPTQPKTILAEWRRDVWQDPDLRLTDELGGGMTTVVTGLKRGGQARWSPDGTRIGGYHRQFGDGSSYLDRAIMSARADGTDERVVVTGRDLDAFNVAAGYKSAADTPMSMPFGGAAWGPDGNAMVFAGNVRREGPTAAPDDDVWMQRLFTVADAGTQLTQVTTGEGAFADNEASWSSALNKIVFVRSTLSSSNGWITGQELWAVDPDGTGLQQLTNFAAGAPSAGYGYYLAAPAVSPGGTQIVLVGNLASNAQRPSGDLWLLDVAARTDGLLAVTSQRVLRGETGASEWHPAWSPDGTRVAYIRQTPANDRQYRYQLLLGSVTTGQNTVIADSTKQSILYPDWRRAPAS